ncbi:MAG: DUF456 domain-containing protein [Candidatus Binatia bacterium]|nr:DUF456 domain-containing protein [Candidatus Binatia bacterium]
MESWIGVLLALLGGAVGVLLVVLGLPGPWLVFCIAVAFALWTGMVAVGWATVLALFVLALLGEWLEFWLGAAAAAKARRSWRVTAGAVVGGLIGALIGAPFFFGLGALLGSLIGSFLGAAAAASLEGADWREVLRVGEAAMRGRWRGFLAKLAVTLLMVAVFVAAVIW